MKIEFRVDIFFFCRLKAPIGFTKFKAGRVDLISENRNILSPDALPKVDQRAGQHQPREDGLVHTSPTHCGFIFTPDVGVTVPPAKCVAMQ